MPTLSSLKESVISALRKPHEASKPRFKRRVTPFKEALDNLKTSKNGVTTCVAFHSFGKCRKEIALFDSDVLANLGQLNMADVQTPIKLMPLMLCASHWEKTMYHNALFLDWLSTYGSKQENPHYESIVVDYQSAVALDDEQASVLSTTVPPKPSEESMERAASPQISSTNEPSHINATPHDQIDRDKPLPFEPQDDVQPSNIPAVSVLMSMDAFASIEFGVVKLEIMYQDNLKCIAMTSDGWRCHEVIDQERLLRARGHLNSSGDCETETDIAPLPPLVLCPGHAQGDLPRIYTEKWTTFTEQRLPKAEAMQKFNAEFWMSVKFFPSAHYEQASLFIKEARVSKENSRQFLLAGATRPRSVSTSVINTGQFEKGDVVKTAEAPGAGSDFLSPPSQRFFEFQGKRFELPTPQEKSSPSDPSAKRAKLEPLFQERSGNPKFIVSPKISETRSMEDLRGDSANLSTLAARNMPSINFPTTGKASPNSTPTNGVLHPELNRSLALRPTPETSIPLKDQLDSQTADLETRTIRPTFKEKAQHPVHAQSETSIDDKLLALMRTPVLPEGTIYVYKSETLKLIKISKKDDIDSRPSILGQCKLASSDTELVDLYWTAYPERVQNLARLELERFQAEVTCQHHLDGIEIRDFEDEHNQWF
ncbi:hypothetical protein V8E51_018411 [Hyaloscypha variabilis]